MDQNEDKQFVINCALPFTRDEMITLATIGVQAAILAAMEAQKADCEIVENEEEEEEVSEPQLLNEGADKTIESHIHLSFAEIERLYIFAKASYKPTDSRNRFTLSEMISKDGAVSDLFINYGDGKAVLKVTEPKDWK